MMDKINITYIDDKIDTELSKFLDRELELPREYEKIYNEVVFLPESGYDQLIFNPIVKMSNVIIIDSHLFENARIINGKFSGEEFKIILRKYYPFIEVIVITQNDIDEKMGMVQKYNVSCGKSAEQYYKGFIPQLINDSIEKIEVFRSISEKLRDNECLDKLLKEKILNCLAGLNQYDELSKSDIDGLIKSFNDMKEIYDE